MIFKKAREQLAKRRNFWGAAMLIDPTVTDRQVHGTLSGGEKVIVLHRPLAGRAA